MTYCLGIMTSQGLVMASDSRTNAGIDQINISRKMHTFAAPGERVFIVMTSGSLSLSQSILALLRNDWDEGAGLATSRNFYEAAREIGARVRQVSDMDREALERDDFRFNVHIILGGQIAGQAPELYMIYPQGNPLKATEDSPYLQIGETKYGRPILDRGLRFDGTSLEEAALYALLSLDSTMRSNVSVGPPIDLIAYERDSLDVHRQRRFGANDPDLLHIHAQWEQSLRRAVLALPRVRFAGDDTPPFE